MNGLIRYMKWLWRNMRGVRWNDAARILLGISRVLLGLFFIYVSKHFIDVTTIQGNNSQIWWEVAFLAFLSLLSIALGQVQYYMQVNGSAFLNNRIRLRIFSHLFERKMYDAKDMHTGDLTSRLGTDVSVVTDAIITLIPGLFITFFQLIAAFCFMTSLDPHLAWILVILTPAIIGLGKFLSSKLKRMTKDIREQDSRIQALLQEGLLHNTLLKSLESGASVIGNLSEMQTDLISKIRNRARFTLITRSLIAVCFSMGYLIAFVWGGMQLRSGAITFGVMTSFLQLVGQIQRPIIDIIGIIPSFIHSTASIDRLDELEDLPTEEQKEPMVMEGQLGVRIEDIDFKYVTGEDEVLHHFSHNFKPGSHTAIVGRTGAGKTTLFRLLLALVSPIKGKLTLYNNHEEHPIDVSTRCNFVFVPQGNTLLSGTIRENLLLANAYATEEEMINALHTAVADFVLELPEGLDARCGERGKGLSEGQAQRIAIARGLLRPGNILLLDEISSSLDMNTEKEMFERLFHNYPQKTMIFITHREKVGELCENRLRIGND